MVKRFRGFIAAFALLAIAVLLFRPMLLDVMGMPFGAHDSESVALARAQGTPHCEMLTDCETVSISNVGLHLGGTALMPLLIGAVIVFVLRRERIPGSWKALTRLLLPSPSPADLHPLADDPSLSRVARVWRMSGSKPGPSTEEG